MNKTDEQTNWLGAELLESSDPSGQQDRTPQEGPLEAECPSDTRTGSLGWARTRLSESMSQCIQQVARAVSAESVCLTPLLQGTPAKVRFINSF